ncbi:phage tail protein [Edwardsiella anguillarum]|uniref:phage tail protein n=1 Tax=Edwardsiella anguillarum TaxID=1821960 RepID=UPI0024B6E16D|nr:phage tail protein [Edwardsiella anguillarum]WHQ13383.1 phage tail protein [Edwardsiella anguillarum]
MHKAQLIRELLAASVPHLQKNPDALRVFINKGRIVATTGHSTSFEYQYTLELLITDYTDSPDTLIVPLVGWMSFHQQEAFANSELREQAFQFETEAIDHQSYDISIKLALTERVIVRQCDNGLEAKHCNDQPPEGGYNGWEIACRGETIVST